MITGDVVATMLPVMDNLQKAAEAKSEDTGYQDGVKLVYRQFAEALKSLGLEEIAASEIQEKTIGLICDIDVITDSYEKTVQDKETGLDKIETKYVNHVKTFKKVINENPNNEEETEDYGF